MLGTLLDSHVIATQLLRTLSLHPLDKLQYLCLHSPILICLFHVSSGLLSNFFLPTNLQLLSYILFPFTFLHIGPEPSFVCVTTTIPS